ncbi:hypothetical protein L226DRAFT_153466 [Lentinus tigrinus ALCF2SS1-7]|uniref:uncharacterized protein n=1 Tax=Lentinus tigrinus ALCF2SS1-7 TaxID=1328758 RepID=UPI0011662707|nr:hypothetical protein L226DRAFT_153466 [Lentinus tigrinus ALCF2SS1-7]
MLLPSTQPPRSRLQQVTLSWYPHEASRCCMQCQLKMATTGVSPGCLGLGVSCQRI